MRPYARLLLWYSLCLLLLGSLLVFSRPVAVAQGGPIEIDIAYSEAIERSEQELELRVYFTFRDGTRKAVNPEVAQAAYQLDEKDGGLYPDVEIEQPKDAINVMLVLDASGSMGNAVNQLIQVATGFVDNIPEGMRVGITFFDDKINLIQDFTSNKDTLKKAIASYRVKNLAPTCLFDATLDALGRIGSLGKVGRRAVIVFTDGVDQLAPPNTNKPCSKGNIDQVIQLATAKSLRIPIYAIGFRNKDRTTGKPGEVDPNLRVMAQSTGGFFAVSENLGEAFQRAIEDLLSQKRAKKLIKPCQGSDKPADLRIQLDSGENLRGSTTFDSPREYCFKTPTPTNTSTPLPPVAFDIPAPGYDAARRAYLVGITSVISGEQIKELKVEMSFENGTSAIAQFSQPFPIPNNEIVLQIPPDAPKQNFTIRIVAVDNAGINLFQNQRQVGWDPTPVPTNTLTPTPVPIGAQIDSGGISYVDPAIKDVIQIKLLLFTQERIGNLKVTIVDADKNQLIRTIEPITVATLIKVSMDGIVAGKYAIGVFAMAPDGQQLSVSQAEFVHDRQPTPTITPSPTATARVAGASVDISAFVQDRARAVFVAKILTQNEDLIKKYRVNLIETGSKTQLQQTEHVVPPYDKLEVPFDKLPAVAKLIFNLQGLDTDGKVISDFAFEFEFVNNTNTPVPTATITPSPTPSGFFDILGRMLGDPQQRLPVLAVFGVLAGGLMLLMFVALRPRKKAATGTGFLAGMTGAVDVSSLEGQLSPEQRAKLGGPSTAAPPGAPSRRTVTPAAPVVQPPSDATAAVPYLSMPTATVFVETSRDAGGSGKTMSVDHTPFTLGRRNRDLNFDNDDNVSRNHAEIIFENGIFYLRDGNSTHGSFVDEQQVPPGGKLPLYNQAQIRLGTTTLIRFMAGDAGGGAPGGPGYGGYEGGAGYDDPDRTRPEMPGFGG